HHAESPADGGLALTVRVVSEPHPRAEIQRIVTERFIHGQERPSPEGAVHAQEGRVIQTGGGSAFLADGTEVRVEVVTKAQVQRELRRHPKVILEERSESVGPHIEIPDRKSTRLNSSH